MATIALLPHVNLLNIIVRQLLLSLEGRHEVKVYSRDFTLLTSFNSLCRALFVSLVLILKQSSGIGGQQQVISPVEVKAEGRVGEDSLASGLSQPQGDAFLGLSHHSKGC